MLGEKRTELRTDSPLNLRGMYIYKAMLDRNRQLSIVDDLRGILRDAPLFSPVTPSGKEMSVRMSAAGQFGWISDRRGYRYSPTHPNGTAWPAIPARISEIWEAVSRSARDPECCLINFYGEAAKMGMHQDKDEASFDYPVVSISLGDDALFRVGSAVRGGKTESVWLQSGDVVVMGGAARLLHHGVDRVKHGSSALLPKAGRINLTLRVVT